MIYKLVNISHFFAVKKKKTLSFEFNSKFFYKSLEDTTIKSRLKSKRENTNIIQKDKSCEDRRGKRVFRDGALLFYDIWFNSVIHILQHPHTKWLQGEFICGMIYASECCCVFSLNLNIYSIKHGMMIVYQKCFHIITNFTSKLR